MIQLVGSVIMWPHESVPDGYLVADGSAISRTTYAELFAVLGTQYGEGDGSTTFNIPDLRGLFPRFTDLGSGRDANSGSRVPRYGGAATGAGSTQADENLAHLHTWSANTANPNQALPNTVRRVRGGGVLTIGSTSISGGAEARPKNITVAGLIKF